MILVKGKPYRTNLAGTMQLRTIRRVKQETGFGWGTLTNYVRALDPEVPLGDTIADAQFIAWLWAWMLNAGDDIGLDELEALSVDDLQFSTDDAEPEAKDGEIEPDPTPALADSGQGNASPPLKKPASRPATKTSKKPSTRASR